VSRPDPQLLDAGRVRRVLAIRHRAGGDLLLSTPAFHALRRGFPHAALDVVTARGLAPLLEGNPDVTRVLSFDRRSPASQARLYAGLARGGWDVVLDLVSNPRSAFMTALTRARIRVGFDLPGRAWAYTLRLPREPIGAGGPLMRYAPEAALDQVRALGLRTGEVALRLRVRPEAEAAMDAWLAAEGIGVVRPVVACLPAGSWPAKTWPAERFATAMEGLAQEADVLWLWGPGEEELARACRARMQHPSHVAPATGWQELAALLRRCALLVGNDSGPKHVAVALGVPTVTIFGPTHPRTWHPPDGPHTAVEVEGLDCLHCNANTCPLTGDRHMRCMTDLSAERVVSAAREWLRAAARRDACASR
jgi:ADP-heptose:LPS heptosyltransferase